MAKTKVVLNKAGVRELLQSEWIKGVLQEHANNIATRAGDGYATSAYTGKNRANVSVYPETFEAYKDNLTNNTLIKSLRG